MISSTQLKELQETAGKLETTVNSGDSQISQSVDTEMSEHMREYLERLLSNRCICSRSHLKKYGDQL